MLEWLECDEAPELGPSLPVAPPGFDGAWWAAMALDGSSLYAFVAGDGGSVPLSLTLYVVPGGFGRRDEDQRVGDRWATLPELWDVADRFALPGALLMPCGPEVLTPAGPAEVPSIAVSGSPPPPFEAGDGTAFQMKQHGALPDTAAYRRMQMAGGPLLI